MAIPLTTLATSTSGPRSSSLAKRRGRPAIGSWFSTRLPNAGNESGLGKDVQDFASALSIGKTVQSVRVVANIGMMMIGKPTEAAAQDDLLIYSLSVARAISPAAEVVGEFVGRANFANIVTPGAEDRGLLRFGMRYTMSGVRVDGGILLGLTPRDPEIGVHRRLHLGLQRLQRALMLSVAKAHAYGNDFLFVPAEQVEGLRLDELSRRLCSRHTGIGGDGVIYYTIAPDGTAQMKLINTDGSPSELSGNGLRCLAALVLYRREQLRRAPMTEVRVDTEAGWKTLVADQPARRPLHVSRGDGTARACRRRADRRRRRIADGDDARDRQPAVRRVDEASCRIWRASIASARRCRRTRDFRTAPTSSSPSSKRRIASAS